MSIGFFHLLFFIIVANGTPILMRYILNNRLALPLDFNFKFFDGKCLFGKSKTWRGVVSSIVVTSLIAVVVGYTIDVGVLIAAAAMSGDILSSFIKRRLNIKPSGMALFLDQIPESVFPAIYLREVFQLNLNDIVILVFVFIVLELLLSQVLYKWQIRKRPY